MGKNLQHTQSGSSPGCVWGVLHVLKYHNWRYVKKKLPHRKGGGSKHSTKAGNHGNVASPAAIGKSPLNDDDARDRAAGEGKASESTSGTKGSVKARLKALISDELSKRKGRHRRSSSCPLQTPLPHNGPVQRPDASPQGLVKTGSLKVAADDHDHDDGSSSTSSNDPLEVSSNQEQMLEAFVNGLAGGDHVDLRRVIENRKQVVEAEPNLQGLGDSTDQEKEVVDAMEVINRNKELFLRMLHDPGYPLACHFHNQQARGKRRMWSKSISLPLSIKRGHGSNKNKQKEGLPSPGKEGNSKSGDQLVQTKSKRYIHSLSMPSPAAKHRKNRIPKHERSASEAGEISFIGSSQNLKDHGLDQVESNRFSNLKQRIKHVIKENKKEKQRITRDGILHKVPYSKMFSKDLKKELAARRLKESPMSMSSKDIHVSNSEANNSVPCDNKNGRPSMRRTPSLRESLARYNKLYESIFNKEAKPHEAEKLNSKKQDDLSSPLRVKKTMGRVFSLPDLRFSSYQLDHHFDRPSSGQDKAATDVIKPKSSELEHPAEPIDSSQSNSTSLERKDSVDDRNDAKYAIIDHPEIIQPGLDTEGDGQFRSGLAIDETQTHDQLDVLVHPPLVSIIEPCEPATDLIPEPLLLEVAPILASTSFSDAEGILEVINFLPPNTTGSFSDHSTESYLDSPVVSESALDHHKPDPRPVEAEDCHLVLKIEPKDKAAEFNYVRRILDLSGLISTEQLLGSWFSDDQPLDPSLVYEEDIAEEEGSSSSCCECDPTRGTISCLHHLIMFDLINEVLMGVYSKSYHYYPKKLISSSPGRIRPMPVGFRVLEEVWSEISWFLSSCPEGVHFLDYAVGKDLTRADGWMNLQVDSEWVGIEIEELVFDDLLEEFVGECYEEFFEQFS